METAQGPFETPKPLLAMGKLTLSGMIGMIIYYEVCTHQHRQTQTGSPWQIVVAEC